VMPVDALDKFRRDAGHAPRIRKWLTAQNGRI
jgi:hypothetical protein